MFAHEWHEITSDSEILSLVNGATIEFDSMPNVPSSPKCTFSALETGIIDEQISIMLNKSIIETTSHCKGEFISSVFTRPKRDSSHRMILNLKKLNDFVTYRHFKMDTLQSILNLVQKNCFMASLDLKDAYYSVSISPAYRKFLCFRWRDKLYRFTCLPNGLSSCPRMFTKILKPALAKLHKLGHIVASYIDDLYLQGKTYDECLSNVIDTLLLFDKLGFIIHPVKSVFKPSREIKLLGFVINSLDMTIKLTKEKATTLRDDCLTLSCTKYPTIRKVAQVIGKIISSFPGVKHGPLHFRFLERDKSSFLKSHKGNFDAHMSLSKEAHDELQWWSDNVTTSFNVIRHDNPSHTLTTDASRTGWGAVYNNDSTGGTWKTDELIHHINYLELFAAFLGLKTFCKHLRDTHIRLRIDNTTAIAVINHMGTSHSANCNKLAKSIWDWCVTRNIWLSAIHIPGIENVTADKESRKINVNTEWMIDRSILLDTLQTLDFLPEVDLFASRINYQFPQYVSFKPDPGAMAIDALKMNISDLKFYAFPPFSVIGTFLQQIEQQKATGVVILPDWPTQAWFPKAMKMCLLPPTQIGPKKRLLILPGHPNQVHPLHKTLTLLVCLLSHTS